MRDSIDTVGIIGITHPWPIAALAGESVSDIEAAAYSEELQQAALVNSAEKFSLLFNRVLETLFIERMDQNEEIFARYMNDPAFQKIIASWLRSEVYQRLAGENKSLLKYNQSS